MRKRTCVSDWVLDITKVIVLTLVVAVTLYPFWNIFIVSINDAQDSIRGGMYFLPRIPTWRNYAQIFKNEQFVHSMGVSVVRTVIGTPLTVMVTSMIAFAMSRKELVGRKFWNLFLVFTMYFSGGMVPTYMLIKNLHLLDNFWVFILPSLMGVYNMILIRSYIESIPESLFEAAKIDGANDLLIYIRMVLPLAKPILMTVALFAAIGQWNSWFDAYLYTSSPNLKPMQAVLVEILNQYQTRRSEEQAILAAQQGVTITPDSIRMAATMVATIPIIMVYPFIQKYFVKGIMIGAVKA